MWPRVCKSRINIRTECVVTKCVCFWKKKNRGEKCFLVIEDGINLHVHDCHMGQRVRESWSHAEWPSAKLHIKNFKERSLINNDNSVSSGQKVCSNQTQVFGQACCTYKRTFFLSRLWLEGWIEIQLYSLIKVQYAETGWTICGLGTCKKKKKTSSSFCVATGFITRQVQHKHRQSLPDSCIMKEWL